mgnify:CR=1 FL=1
MYLGTQEFLLVNEMKLSFKMGYMSEIQPHMSYCS